MGKHPYTITVTAADYLAKITEKITRLEFGTGFKRNIKLHRENRINAIYSSLAIENNSLTIEQVADVINGKLVAGKHADIKEVKNAYNAYDKILTFDPYKVTDFLKAHSLMTDGLIEEAGRFRNGDMGVFNGEMLIHLGVRPEFVPELIADLFAWARETELHPLLMSSVVHFEIETIHPFADGNGRMGRLWQTLLLSKWNEMFAWIPMESVIYDKRQGYYDAIEAARKDDDSGRFIEYTLSALYESMQSQTERQTNSRQENVKRSQDESDSVNDSVNDRVSDSANDSVNDSVNAHIMELMTENNKITATQIAAKISKSTPTVNRRIKQLRDAGLIMRVGSDKSGYWSVR